ncbi:MAG: hypothetical protein F6K10_32185 [Moorea sp. SIO2B7]|nr:hypothetical protein [Moorena sp. SIO2B7]
MTTTTLTPIKRPTFVPPLETSKSLTESQIKEAGRYIYAYGEAGFKTAMLIGSDLMKLGNSEQFKPLFRDHFISKVAMTNKVALADLNLAFRNPRHPQDMELMRSYTIRRCVESGILEEGLLHLCFVMGIVYYIFPSITDHEKTLLPEAIYDLRQANKILSNFLYGVDCLIVLGSSELAFAARAMASPETKFIVLDQDRCFVEKLCLKEDLGIVTAPTHFVSKLNQFI